MTGAATRAAPTGSGRRLLALTAKVLFYAYALTCLVAGVWGVFGARLDFPILFSQPVAGLEPQGVKDVLSQYRFLRGIEAGFGLFSLLYRTAIFTTPAFNRLFLWWMGFGIVARLVGVAFEGIPGPVALVAVAGEVAGIIAIFFDTREVRSRHRPSAHPA